MTIPPELRERQHTASDPDRSIWVSANAGSGKTHVLTQRVIRLLLGGVAPSKILCLTFTKAAAAQMATRVFDALSRWTDMSDAELRAAIVETGAPTPTAPDLVLARRLFTRTIETPGGLKIQTIHAFCERLLHLFPFEANVPARFEVADDLRAQEMLSLAKRAAIAEAQRSAQAPSLALVADLAGAAGIDALLGTAMRMRGAARGRDDLQGQLAQRLGAMGHESVDAVRLAMIREGIAPIRWSEIALVFDGGSANDKKHARRFRDSAAAWAKPDDPVRLTQTVSAYLAIFFDAKAEPRPSLMTQKLAKAHPGLNADLLAERDRMITLRDQLRVAEAIERTNALLALVDATTRRYGAAKITGGLLDFDDLIERTLALLDRSDSSWVLHKLDAGIDHVLVDEAQDTSETQWRILDALTNDFSSGLGGRSQHRSFFVVGDDKQSIFSFQGAAPLMFDTMRSQFERRFKAGQKRFERVSLKTSFRSVPGILTAVDTVFALDAHQDGLVRKPDIWPSHESIKLRLPSLVEIWPPMGAAKTPDPQEWSIPLDTPSDLDPANVVADRVARKIKQLIAPDSNDTVHEGRGETKRPIGPGDILILVRTRGEFFEAVIRALKRHYVPVAGADRLDVANHIAVMDLAVAGRAALLPRDDLSVACVLKSPLFGLTDDDLIAVAPHRAGSLMDALAQAPDQRHRDAHATILGWNERATRATPFAFYVELLGRDGGRKRMEGRLGPEAHDAIDEFLRLALAHERQGAPSLGAFLADIDALESSIKRDMEGAGDAVRVMTVHAAKGLEAKVVFLPDTCAVPAPNLEATIFDLNRETDLPPVLVWSPHKADDSAQISAVRADARRATMREYRRLLYVAMTRAEERLYIAGFYKTAKPSPDCWNSMIEQAFADVKATEIPAFWEDGTAIRRIATSGSLEPSKPLPIVREQREIGFAPDWLFQAVEAQPAIARVRPSRVGGDRDATRKRKEGLVFGSALHQLLQHLPSVPDSVRAASGRAFLAARCEAYPPSMHEALLAQALATLALPDLAPLFAPEAYAELEVMGTLVRHDGRTLDVNGIVDRLRVTADEIIVVDFKSGVPEATVPSGYRDQMALYRHVLAPLWPGRPMRMLLVWTAQPSIVELDTSDLDIAVARLLGASDGNDAAG